MCDYGWDGYNAGEALRERRPLPKPVDRVAQARAASAALLAQVSERISARTAVEAAAAAHPELSKSDLRAAIWYLVGREQLKINWDATLEPGPRA